MFCFVSPPPPRPTHTHTSTVRSLFQREVEALEVIELMCELLHERTVRAVAFRCLAPGWNCAAALCTLERCPPPPTLHPTPTPRVFPRRQLLKKKTAARTT